MSSRIINKNGVVVLVSTHSLTSTRLVIVVQCIACVTAAEEASTISVIVTILSTILYTGGALIDV